MQETHVQSLDWEDPLEKEMATTPPVLLPREIYGQRSLAGYNPWGGKESHTAEPLTHLPVLFPAAFPGSVWC